MKNIPKFVGALEEIAGTLRVFQEVPDILLNTTPQVLAEVLQAIREGWRFRYIRNRSSCEEVWSLSGPNFETRHWNGSWHSSSQREDPDPKEVLGLANIVSVRARNNHAEEIVRVLCTLSALYPDEEKGGEATE